MPTAIDIFRDPEVERDALSLVATSESAALLERFSALVRESGMPDEHAAARYIVDRLRALGIPVTVHAPDLYISLPDRSLLSVTTTVGAREIVSRPPAFSKPTGDALVEAPLVYVPSRYAGGMSSLFDTPDAARAGGEGDPVKGAVVLTEGYAMPGAVEAFERRGAVAQVFIHPGADIHEGICTPIWGAPTDESLPRKPKTPVLSISRPDGERLIKDVGAGAVRASVGTWLREGWMNCLLPVVEIPGTTDPDEFLLVHGHYDSWYVGIGDNATGDAALLELARILWSVRDRLKRSVKIAWWPGHSTGRYAGSTWFADTFALDIDQWCVAQMNIDSPGCAGATNYDEVMWMAEAEALGAASIADALGARATGVRPLRAGDYSFNQIGPTGLYMLLSNIPAAEREARGFYAVGGCGGNTAWHTPRDVMDVADPAILERDLRVYVTTIVRILNAPLHPFDYTAAVDDIRRTVERYQEAAADAFDFGPLLADLHALRATLDRWTHEARAAAPELTSDSARRRRMNATLRRLARILVHVNYAKGERFDHDPATKFGAVPRLEPAATLRQAPESLQPFVRVRLTRESNKIRAWIEQARREVQS